MTDNTNGANVAGGGGGGGANTFGAAAADDDNNNNVDADEDEEADEEELEKAPIIKFLERPRNALPPPQDAIDRLRRMIDDDPSCLDERDEFSNAPLSVAALKGHAHLVHFLIDYCDVPLEDKGGGGWTALVCCSRHGHTETVKVLLEAGANLNVVESALETPLMKAAGFGFLYSALVLLEAGADTRMKNENSWTAEDMTCGGDDALQTDKEAIVLAIRRAEAQMLTTRALFRAALHTFTTLRATPIGAQVLLQRIAETLALPYRGHRSLEWLSADERTRVCTAAFVRQEVRIARYSVAPENVFQRMKWLRCDLRYRTHEIYNHFGEPRPPPPTIATLLQRQLQLEQQIEELKQLIIEMSGKSSSISSSSSNVKKVKKIKK